MPELDIAFSKPSRGSLAWVRLRRGHKLQPIIVSRVDVTAKNDDLVLDLELRKEQSGSLVRGLDRR